MYQLLLLSIILSGAFFFSGKFNKKTEQSIPLWIFVIIIVLYIFGLFGGLQIGVYAVVILSVLAFIYTVYAIIRYKKAVLTNILTPGLAVFILLFLLSWWAQRGRMMTSWDEFSHWGLTIKNMYIMDAYSNCSGSTVFFPAYPPGTALFEYLFTKFAGSFLEGDLYRAMNMLYFGMAISLFKNLKWKDYGQIFLRLVLIMILPLTFFENFFTEIYVDAILGIFFAYILITYFTNEYNIFNVLGISMALFVLSIIKSSGAGLAIMAVIIIGIDMFFFQRKNLKLLYANKDRVGKYGMVVGMLCPILFALLAKYSWALYLNITQTADLWIADQMTVGNAIKVLLGGGESYQNETIKNFFAYLIDNPLTNNPFKFNFLTWLVAMGLLFMALTRVVAEKEEQGRLKVTFISLYVGALIYCLTLLLIYLFSFSEFEAVGLASMSRYLKTYLLGLIFFFVFMIVLKEHGSKHLRRTTYSIVICILLFVMTYLMPLANITIQANYSAEYTVEVRKQYEPINRIEQIADSCEKRVFFISVGNSGFDYNVARYIATPVKLYDNLWSIGDPYFDGDIWTKNIDAKEWEDILIKECSYVYVHRTNDYFNKNYGKLFEQGAAHNDTLYRVEECGQGALLRIVN